MNKNALIYESNNTLEELEFCSEGNFGYEAQVMKAFCILEEIPRDQIRYFFTWYNIRARDNLASGRCNADSFIGEPFKFKEQATEEELRGLFQLAQQRHPDNRFGFTPESLNIHRGQLSSGRTVFQDYAWLHNKVNPPTVNNFKKMGYGVIIPQHPFTGRQTYDLDRLMKEYGYNRLL